MRLEIEDWSQSFCEWCVSYAKRCVEKGSWEVVMMFLWQVWNTRNMWVFEKRKMDPMVICTRTMNLLGEFEAATIRDSEPINTEPSHNVVQKRGKQSSTLMQRLRRRER